MKKSGYYRSDIDGLRAVAIIPVLLFHLGVVGFSGGYIGVDVFFVISGFLITSIIVREIKEDRFSLLNFWSRRVRRIIPALSFVLIATTLAGYFIILYPPDFVDFGYSLVAQSLFLINLFFMRTDAYFAAPSETIPLLHTWSLAVEEQFYILFPLALLLIYKIKKEAVIPVITTVAVASLLYSVYLVNINPEVRFSVPFLPHIWGGATNSSAGFYFPLARAWELMAGSLIALTTIKLTKRASAEFLSAIGLGLIVAAILFLNEDSAFPGLGAIAPVLGTCLIILSNQEHQTFVKNLLSFPIFIGIGLISYSLYLWHWPIIVLTKFYTQTPLETKTIIFILFFTFLLSYVSYKWVETPFRTKTLWPHRNSVLVFGLILLFSTASLGITIIKSNGMPERAPLVSQQIAEAALDENPRLFECFKNSYKQLVSDRQPCLLGNQSKVGKSDFVLWGDSHANAIMPGFDQAAKELGQKGTFFAIGGCAPLVHREQISKDLNCIKLKQSTITYINDNQIDKVFIVSAWKETYIDLNQNEVQTNTALAETISNINPQTKIIIMKRVPFQTDFEIREKFYAHLNKEVLEYTPTSFDDHLLTTKTAQSAIDEQANKNNVSIMDPTESLCSNGLCPVTISNNILYKDSDHINTAGALFLVNQIKTYLNQ